MPHCIGLLYPLKALLYCTIIAAMLHNFCSRRMRWRRWRRRTRWRRWMRRTRRSKRLSVTGSTVIHHSLTVHKTDYDAVQYTLCNNHTLTNTCSAFSQSRRFLNAHTHTALSWVSRRSYCVLYSVHCTVTSMYKPYTIRCRACKEYHQPYSTSYSRKARFQLEMFQGLGLTWNPTPMVIWTWNGIKSARSADLLDLSQNSDGKG